MTGGCGIGDAYFGPLPTAATNCRFGANVDVFWGTMALDDLAVSSNFTVRVNGVAASPPGANQPSGVWTVPSNALIASGGANNVTVEIDWTDTTTGHVWEQGPGNGQCRNGGQNPCRYDGAPEQVHRTFVGTTGTSGAVALVHSASSGFVSGSPGPSYATVADGGNTVNIWPTVGIKSVLRTGILTTLRLDDPQANQTLQCDPDYAQGQEFSAFRYGCKPWYGANPFTDGLWWNTTTRQCPDPRPVVLLQHDAGPVRQELVAPTRGAACSRRPGMSTGQVGDDIAVATDNCTNINNNSCQQFGCVYDGNYDGKAGNPNGWVQLGGDSRYPRVVNLFIAPYQGSKGLSGAGDTDPHPRLRLLLRHELDRQQLEPERLLPRHDLRPRPESADSSDQRPEPSEPARSRASSSRPSTTSRARSIPWQSASKVSSRPAASRSFDEPSSRRE